MIKNEESCVDHFQVANAFEMGGDSKLLIGAFNGSILLPWKLKILLANIQKSKSKFF